MRTALVLSAVGLTSLLLGTTCFPLIDNTAREPVAGQTLALAIGKPDTDKTVGSGASVKIEWSAANLSGAPATIAIRVESRTASLKTTTITTFELQGTGDSGTVNWDTTGFSGPYAIVGRIATTGLAREVTAAGKITVDAAPTFAFTKPKADVTFRPGVDPDLVIAWKAKDESATIRIGLDPDTNHDNDNEIYIHEVDLEGSSTDKGDQSSSPTSGTDDGTTRTGNGSETETETGETGPGTTTGGTTTGSTSFEWDGTDIHNDDVPVGTYNLFAFVTDDVNPALTAEGLGQITVKEGSGSQSGQPEITEPAEDVTFLTSDDKLTIEYQTNQTADCLVDIKIDTDDSHSNGNEKTILSQEFVKKNEDPDPFDWNGKDSGGANVGPGIYRVFLSVSTGEGSPKTAEAEGLVFRRTSKKQPLIALLNPSSVTKVDPGAMVTIRWRDDDPNKKATIRLVVDTNPSPLAPSEKRLEILSGRKADPDDVQDSFVWQVPNTLEPGTYYVIGFIDDDGSGNNSVAPGKVIVNDPTKQ